VVGRVRDAEDFALLPAAPLAADALRAGEDVWVTQTEAGDAFAAPAILAWERPAAAPAR